MRIPTLVHDIEWRHARAWAGRRLVLRRPWLDFPAGTPCRVMCIVDFGDGVLFWIRTDDAAQRDIDQVTRGELETHFEVLEGTAVPSSRLKHSVNRSLLAMVDDAACRDPSTVDP